MRQALVAVAILFCWFAILALFFWATRGADRSIVSVFMFSLAGVSWLGAEAVGTWRAQVWPASAMAIVGSLSLGFGVSMSTPEMRAAIPSDALATISAVAAIAMLAFLARFRLPGLVSPIITFLVVALFLGLYGVDQESLAKVEGLSARGILSALMNSPLWAAAFGVLGLSSVLLARRLDLKGDDFGVASARPLHLIGAGVLALVIGRALAIYPFPTDLITLLIVWIAAFYWSLRINRVAVLCAIHLALMKPLVLAVTGPVGWRPDLSEWSVIVLVILIFDMAVWPRLHQLSLSMGWTLGPGGRVPRERDGWVWRYWPYA
ncbi:MAG: hypothetical protein AAGD13_00380 [Pseudomonadota bacterium]